MTTPSEGRRGLLVAVANPEAVAPLIAIAIAASDSADPPPLVLGLAPPEPGVTGPASANPAEVPPTPALLAAIDYARRLNAAIQTRAVRSADPAAAIINAAQAVRGILLGYHRAKSGGDTMGGVVHEVFTRTRSLPIDVGVFIQDTDQPFERIYAAVDGSPDGRAALAWAVRVARKNKAKLRALVVSNSVAHADTDTDLIDMVSNAQASMGRLFHTDVLTERSLHRLLEQTPGRLLVVGRKFASEVGMPLDEVPGGDRCVLVVQGAGR